MNERIKNTIKKSINIKEVIYYDSKLIEKIDEVMMVIYTCFQQGGKVLFCGNGGSAADAQHLAAEFSGRFYFDRPPLYSEALHVNTSYLTAVANDYTYDYVYSRMVQAMGKMNDVLVGLSTSGNSPNVVKAFESAKQNGMVTIGFTGQNGGNLKEVSDYLIKVPSNDTPRIQECHIMIGHIICELVEEKLFKK